MITIDLNREFSVFKAGYLDKTPEMFQYKVPVYHPPYHLLEFFLECDREIGYKGQRIAIKSRDVFISFAGVPYTVFIPRGNTLSVAIPFTVSTPGSDGQPSAGGQPRLIRLPFVSTPHNQLETKTMFEQIVYYSSVSNVLYRYKTEALLKQLLIDMAIGNQDSFDNSAILPVKKAVEYIQRRSNTLFTTDQLAAHCGMSRRTFIRAFERYTGKTVKNFQKEYKIGVACNILDTNPNTRIKEIAEMLGYCDEYYFSNVFKSVTGVSPSQYRLGVRQAK